jgi:uncharacterized protein
MTTEAPAAAAESRSAVHTPVIDADVHNVVPATSALFPYLPAHWVEHINNTLFKGPVDTAYPRKAPSTARPGSIPPEKTPAGSSLKHLISDHLDPHNVELAILSCNYEVDSLHNPDAAVALARAVNDWQINEWLEKDSRLRASIVVPSQIPHLAAQEIDRVGDHPGFVQVFLPVRSQHLYGTRNFHPMWEAITRHNLVAAVSFGGAPGIPPTPSGWPSYYFEEYAGMAQVFQSQLVNIVSEGVFDQFPNARVAFLEAGWTWLPAFMWRFDKEWRNLRRLVPWLKRRPSDYIKEYVRFGLQPLDAPPEPRHLLQVVDQIGTEDVLMYASDYPHLHDADPEAVLFPDLPPTLVQKIRTENARAFYRL